MAQIHSDNSDDGFLTAALLRRILEELQELRDRGAPEDSVEGFLAATYRDVDKASRKRIYDFSLGKTPEDDIDRQNVIRRTHLNETTVELELRQPQEDLQEGALLFLEGKCWNVIAVDGANILLRICK